MKGNNKRRGIASVRVRGVLLLVLKEHPERGFRARCEETRLGGAKH